jgi:Putative zinc-finger
MEHRVAEQTNAVETYLLDEFTPEERANFEEHLFDCPICGERVRQGAMAIENMKQVFREEAVVADPYRRTSANRGWAAWLRVPALFPTLAALALAVLVIYQNWIYIPSLEQPQVLSSDVIAPLAREGAPVVAINRGLRRFNLNFEVDAPQPYASYTCEFRRQDGTAILKLNSGPRDVASFTLGLLLPSNRFPAGRYVMILRPAAEPETEIQRYNFVIQDGGHTP